MKTGAGSAARPDNRQQEKPAVEFLPPLKPQRKLVVVLGVTFAIWVGLLVALYFTTVYPHRNDVKAQESETTER